MTLPPLFDAHGITIQDTADGFHTNDEINGFVNQRGSVPEGERASFYQAVSAHWNHIHFGDGGDKIYLGMGRDGSIFASTLAFDYGDLTGYDGLVIPHSP